MAAALSGDLVKCKDCVDFPRLALVCPVLDEDSADLDDPRPNRIVAQTLLFALKELLLSDTGRWMKSTLVPEQTEDRCRWDVGKWEKEIDFSGPSENFIFTSFRPT
jgi:hypothetical protein